MYHESLLAFRLAVCPGYRPGYVCDGELRGHGSICRGYLPSTSDDARSTNNACLVGVDGVTYSTVPYRVFRYVLVVLWANELVGVKRRWVSLCTPETMARLGVRCVCVSVSLCACILCVCCASYFHSVTSTVLFHLKGGFMELESTPKNHNNNAPESGQV